MLPRLRWRSDDDFAHIVYLPDPDVVRFSKYWEPMRAFWQSAQEDRSLDPDVSASGVNELKADLEVDRHYEGFFMNSEFWADWPVFLEYGKRIARFDQHHQLSKQDCIHPISSCLLAWGMTCESLPRDLESLVFGNQLIRYGVRSGYYIERLTKSKNVFPNPKLLTEVDTRLCLLLGDVPGGYSFADSLESLMWQHSRKRDDAVELKVQAWMVGSPAKAGRPTDSTASLLVLAEEIIKSTFNTFILNAYLQK